MTRWAAICRPVLCVLARYFHNGHHLAPGIRALGAAAATGTTDGHDATGAPGPRKQARLPPAALAHLASIKAQQPRGTHDVGPVVRASIGDARDTRPNHSVAYVCGCAANKASTENYIQAVV